MENTHFITHSNEIQDLDTEDYITDILVKNRQRQEPNRMLHKVVFTYKDRNLPVTAINKTFFGGFKLQDIHSLPKVPYIKHIMNPCFLTVSEKTPGIINISNINIAQLKSKFEAMGLELHCLPSFFVAGFEKCGTSDIYHKLSLHQDVHKIPKEFPFWGYNARKETLNGYISNYFGGISDETFKQYVEYLAENLHHLHGHYVGTMPIGKHSMIGDFTSIIAHNAYPNWGLQSLPLVAYSVHRVIPQAKIIFLLRNPVEKVISMYNYFMFSENHTKSAEEFDQFVLEFSTWWQNCRYGLNLSPRQCMYFRNLPPGITASNLTQPSYWHEMFMRAIYSVYIEDWLQYFPRQQVLFIKYETYASHTMEVIVDKVLPFVGLQPYNLEIRDKIIQEIKTGRILNQRTFSVPILSRTRESLEKFYRPYNQRLIEILGDQQFHWY